MKNIRVIGVFNPVRFLSKVGATFEAATFFIDPVKSTAGATLPCMCTDLQARATPFRICTGPQARAVMLRHGGRVTCPLIVVH